MTGKSFNIFRDFEIFFACCHCYRLPKVFFILDVGIPILLYTLAKIFICVNEKPSDRTPKGFLISFASSTPTYSTNRDFFREFSLQDAII